MKKYLVGGAVRNKILGLPAKDKDYVVIGSSVNEMLSLGFEQVGKHFPVFLHPETRDEYALARTEVSTGNKHGDFTVSIDQVTLRDDLYRRDLTINALAEDENGEIIDYFGGLNDIQSKVLRHVSVHFVEDPLRVLRVARFAANFGFSIAPETLELMKNMSLKSLPKERIHGEISKVLTTDKLKIFCQVLVECGKDVELEQYFDCKLILQYINDIKNKSANEEILICYLQYLSQGNCFKHNVINIQFWGRKIGRIINYISIISKIDIDKMNSEDLLQYLNQDLNRLANSRIVYSLYGLKNIQFFFLCLILIRGSEFSNMTINQIRQEKLNIINVVKIK